MRSLVLSIGICLFALGAAWAQSSGGGGLQLPVGQTVKDFQFPLYQDGQLKATLAATDAKGITLNRAEATNLKIEIYDNGKVTTTVTSPKADLYVSDRKMRTKNTVQIERSDMEATAKTCDFDMINKKFLLRDNVKVVLKNFDAPRKPSPTGSASTPLDKGAPTDPLATPAPPTPAPDSAQTNAVTPAPSTVLPTPGTP